MDGNVQCLSSTSAGSNHGSIEPARRTGLAGGSFASRFAKRLFDLRAAYGFAKRHPSPAVVQEVVANRRGLRAAAVIAVAFGMIASDASVALAGQCADDVAWVRLLVRSVSRSPERSLRTCLSKVLNPF